MNNKIFVFGTSCVGAHGRGAATIAMREYGAKYGVGSGMCGNSYAISVYDENMNDVDIFKLHSEIVKFKEFARSRPDLTFNVDGLVNIHPSFGFNNSYTVGPMFSDAPPNVNIPVEWEYVNSKIRDTVLCFEPNSSLLNICDCGQFKHDIYNVNIETYEQIGSTSMMRVPVYKPEAFKKLKNFDRFGIPSKEYRLHLSNNKINHMFPNFLDRYNTPKLMHNSDTFVIDNSWGASVSANTLGYYYACDDSYCKINERYFALIDEGSIIFSRYITSSFTYMPDQINKAYTVPKFDIDLKIPKEFSGVIFFGRNNKCDDGIKVIKAIPPHEVTRYPFFRLNQFFTAWYISAWISYTKHYKNWHVNEYSIKDAW